MRKLASKHRRVATGHLALWEGGMLWTGRLDEPIDLHAHHAIQITFALEGEVRVGTGTTDAWISSPGVIVLPRVPHALDARGITVALLFVEPESLEGRRLIERQDVFGMASVMHDARDSAIAALTAWWRHPRTKRHLAEIGRCIVAELAAGPSVRPGLDPRVQKAVAYMRGALDKPITLADAARIAALSPSRFRHLFIAETGLTFRAFLLWLRLMRAVTSMTASRTITEAAYEAGFSDAAHLSRTFRSNFGISPAMLGPG